MKICCCVLALLVVPAGSFTSPAFVVRNRILYKTALCATRAEEYLAQCLVEWNQLETELSAFKAGPDKDNELAAADLAEKMLHKALDTARATRDVEFERSAAAHQAFDDALEEKLEDQAALSKLDNEAMGTANQVSMVEGLDASYEDTERLRDMSVGHAAHDEGMDWMNKIANAESAAAKAKAEFTSAERKLEVLAHNEKDLKVALHGLHDAKNALMMKKWNQQRGA